MDTFVLATLKKKQQKKQGMAGNTNPLAQDYLVWVKSELGNFMTYNSYVNEETKKKKTYDLNVKVIYVLDIKVEYCKHSRYYNTQQLCEDILKSIDKCIMCIFQKIATVILTLSPAT